MLTLGPPLPKALCCFSMLEIHGDAYIFGGYGSGYNSAIYKLTCSSGICSWSTLNQELKVARGETVAIRVPDDFLSCEGTTTTTTTTTATTTMTGMILLESQVAHCGLEQPRL